jgi:hypothetical protein
VLFLNLKPMKNALFTLRSLKTIATPLKAHVDASASQCKM